MPDVREISATRVCRVDELPAGEVVVVELDRRIAVFNVDGEYFALDDRCTHQEAYLSDGFFDGSVVECPLHATCFDLRTGVPTGPPATRTVRTYKVRVSDGEIFVLVKR